MKIVGIALCLSLAVFSVMPKAASATKCPNLAIVLDRSGSMNEDPSGKSGVPTKFDIAKSVLTTILKEYNNILPIGFVMFAEPDGCKVMNGFDVPPAYNTQAAILSVLAPATAATDTPTCEAINAVAATASMKDATRGQYILLITDGSPTCSNCSGSSPVDGTTKAIRGAFLQSPSIKTFVVGFGALPTSDQQSMNSFADAGGVPYSDPNPDPNLRIKFYAADSKESLLAALKSILGSITSDGAGNQCDETCYRESPCTGGQICVSLPGGMPMCKPNPCVGVTCNPGQYCYTDGLSAGVCVSPCVKSCPSGQRCIRGTCQPDACERNCGDGLLCDAQSKQCQADALCASKICHPGQGCFAGVCKDDPCGYITCPNDLLCVPFEGTCLGYGLNPPMPPSESRDGGSQDGSGVGSEGDNGGSQATGCSCDVTDTRSRNMALLSPLLFLLAVLVWRRRRRRILSL